MPPPNANDLLHIGYAMFVALEDVLIRYHRMIAMTVGFRHRSAGIETQFVLKKLQKEGKSVLILTAKPLPMIWDYVQRTRCCHRTNEKPRRQRGLEPV